MIPALEDPCASQTRYRFCGIPRIPGQPAEAWQDGFLLLDRTQFAASFAAEVAPGTAAVMANAQVPWGLDALNGAVTQPAWATRGFNRR